MKNLSYKQENYSLQVINIIEIQRTYLIIMNSQLLEAFKEADTNVQTQARESDGTKFMQDNQYTKTRSLFKQMQVKILNIFTLAKSQLSSIYQNIVNRIKKIERYISSELFKPMPQFFTMIQQIENQIAAKIQNLPAAIEECVCSIFSFDQLLTFAPDPSVFCQNISQIYKKSNNSNISSNHRLTFRQNNQTILDIDGLSSTEYKTAIKVKPVDKRIDNLGWLSAKWDLLEQISLENKKICRLIPFSTVIAPNLLQLNLSCNQINSLDFMVETQYPILKSLNLYKNYIFDLDGLQNCFIPNIKFLNLSENKLKSLKYLHQCQFRELIDINLSNNRLQNVQNLTQCDFPKLEVLNLDNNRLKNIDFIEKSTFYRIKFLSFCHNEVKSVECLRKCKLLRLQAILGYNNKIDSINFLSQCEIPKIKSIMLNNNCIDDISVLEKTSFDYLEQFDLEYNSLSPKQLLCIVTKNDQIRKAKKKYPFIQI